jgi:hypothetical protein
MTHWRLSPFHHQPHATIGKSSTSTAHMTLLRRSSSKYHTHTSSGAGFKTITFPSAIRKPCPTQNDCSTPHAHTYQPSQCLRTRVHVGCNARLRELGAKDAFSDDWFPRLGSVARSCADRQQLPFLRLCFWYLSPTLLCQSDTHHLAPQQRYHRDKEPSVLAAALLFIYRLGSNCLAEGDGACHWARWHDRPGTGRQACP